MADKAVEQPEVAVEEVDKCDKKSVAAEKAAEKVADKADEAKAAAKDDEVADDKTATENGDAEIGDKNKKDAKNGDTVASTDDEKLCSITKRKSTGGGDAPEGTPAEGATPEKKAKLAAEKDDKDAADKAATEAENGDQAAQITA